MPAIRWSKDWTVGVRVRVNRRDQLILGEGRAELLAAIGAHRSITAAARAVGMSYRRAWTLIQEVNEAAGEPLVQAAVGGLQGGGARLTERGRFAVDAYRQLERATQDSAGAALHRLVASESSAPHCLHVAAAISLQEALGEILAAFALRRPLVRVRVVYGASNELADHLLGGAPGDLFIAAEAGEIDRLERAGKLAAGTRRAVAQNTLAVIGAPETAPIAKLRELAGKKFDSVALAEPACPLGRYSQACLESAGLLAAIRAKALLVDNSRAVLSAVGSGAADAGLAFASDAARSDRCATLLRIARARAAAEYVAGVLRGAPAADVARELLEFLQTPAAVRSLRRCGLRPAPAPKW